MCDDGVLGMISWQCSSHGHFEDSATSIWRTWPAKRSLLWLTVKATHVASLSLFLVGHMVEILDLQYPLKTSLIEHIDLLGGGRCCFQGVACR